MELGTVSSGPSALETRHDCGHRVDPGDRPAAHEVPEAAPVEAVIEDEAGAGDQRRQHTHDLGVYVEQREGVEATVLGAELQVRRHAGRRVEQLVLAQPDDFGRSGRARRGQHDAAGVGALWRRRPGRRHASVLEVIDAVQLHPRGADALWSRPVRPHHIHPCACQGGCEAALAAHRQGRVERCDPESGAHRTQKRVGEGHRVADDEADGREATGAHPSQEVPPPVRALLQPAEGQRFPASGMFDVGPLAQQHRAGADDVAQCDVGCRRRRRAGRRHPRGEGRHQYIIRGSA